MKVTRKETVKILNEYFDKICEDIDFQEIFDRTGIVVYPRTKKNLCDVILELEKQGTK